MMQRFWKDGGLAISTFLIFIGTMIIVTFDIMPKEYIEELSNGLMYLIALVNAIVVWNFHKDNDNLRLVLNNLSIPMTAFLMNINVFEHKIRQEQILNDLWSCHLGWIICAILQILFLSNLGKNLLYQIFSFFNSVRDVISLVWSIIWGVLEDIKNINRDIRLTVFVGSILWLVYLSIQIYNKGISKDSFGDSLIWRSVRLWLAVIIICYLVHLIPTISQKLDEALQKMSGIKVLVITTIIIFIVMAYIVPSVLQTLIMFLMFPIVLMGLLWFIIKKVIKKINIKNIDGQKVDNLAGIELKSGNIEPKDLFVFLCCFIGFPLLVLMVATAFSSDGFNIMKEQNDTSFMTWWGFFKEALDISKDLLELIL